MMRMGFDEHEFPKHLGIKEHNGYIGQFTTVQAEGAIVCVGHE